MHKELPRQDVDDRIERRIENPHIVIEEQLVEDDECGIEIDGDDYHKNDWDNEGQSARYSHYFPEISAFFQLDNERDKKSK